MRETEYIGMVDEELARLRARRLGQDIPFSCFVPEGMGEEEEAEWLADRLLFALAELCPEAEKVELDRERRGLMIPMEYETLEAYRLLRTDAAPPRMFRALEAAMLRVAGKADKTE